MQQRRVTLEALTIDKCELSSNELSLMSARCVCASSHTCM